MPLKIVIFAIWCAFGLYWFIAAVGAKQGHRPYRFRAPSLFVLVAVIVLRVVKPHGAAAPGGLLQAAGMGLLVCGVGLAVWARIHLGRNWGMPMTQNDEPELVTSGPYRVVRHPIYSGLLLAFLGTALASSIYLLVAWGVLAVYFVYSARVEERHLTTSFPSAYPGYKARTKMLIPFVL